MKKKISLAIVVGILIIVLFVIISEQGKTTWLQMDDYGIYISLRSDNRNVLLRPWFDENNDLYYFFLPAFADERNIYMGRSLNGVNIDDINLMGGHKFTWQPDEDYQIAVGDASYHVRFMRSENLPAFFIDTESGSMEYIHADKKHEEPGNLAVISADGHLQYAGALDKISGRGQSSWGKIKNPYNISLQHDEALCGLEAGKKWTLLALYYEHDKVHSKIIFDMAKKLGIPYTPECTWVDLYCNGEYMGLYLLTEAITVGDGRVEIHDLEKDNENINSHISIYDAELIGEDGRSGYEILDPANYTGGYLIEKNNRYPLNPHFTTSAGYVFEIKSPKYVSLKQVDYIAEFVQSIENMIVLGDFDYRNYIDMESFARQFLLDKIVLDIDSMRYSSYYYKDQYQNILFSGPVWDYDRAMGEVFSDYAEPIEESEGIQNKMQAWYNSLYQDPEFYSILVEEYKKIIPYMENVLTYGIDDYVEFIGASVEMDNVLMSYASKNETVGYDEYDSYVRYLKFFLANRLNYLNSIWKISDAYFEVPAFTGEYHDVIFKDVEGNIVERRKILDGEFIESFPVLYQEENIFWRMNNGRIYTGKIPIFEDTVFVAWYSN